MVDYLNLMNGFSITKKSTINIHYLGHKIKNWSFKPIFWHWTTFVIQNSIVMIKSNVPKVIHGDGWGVFEYRNGIKNTEASALSSLTSRWGYRVPMRYKNWKKFSSCEFSTFDNKKWCGVYSYAPTMKYQSTKDFLKTRLSV